jgi:hypothetical protein
MDRLVLALVAALIWSSATAAVDIETAAQIYQAAAVREQVRASLGAMPARIQQLFEADASVKLSDAQIAAIGAAAEHGFRIDVFEPAALTALAGNLDATSARKVKAFLAGDVGLRMVAADRALARLDEHSIDKVMSGELKVASTPKRDVLTVKLERAARSSESTVQIFTSMGRAVAIGTAIGTGADPIAVDERSRAAAEGTRKAMEENMREPLRRYMAYGYRDLSEADLKRLLSFLESRAGTAYVTAYTAAMGAGYDAMGKKCGEQLGEAFRELAQTQNPGTAAAPH